MALFAFLLNADQDRPNSSAPEPATRLLASGGSIFRVLLGAIAQLGERVNGIHEVGGSIPPGSTRFLKDNTG